MESCFRFHSWSCRATRKRYWQVLWSRDLGNIWMVCCIGMREVSLMNSRAMWFINIRMRNCARLIWIFRLWQRFRLWMITIYHRKDSVVWWPNFARERVGIPPGFISPCRIRRWISGFRKKKILPEWLTCSLKTALPENWFIRILWCKWIEYIPSFLPERMMRFCFITMESIWNRMLWRYNHIPIWM